MRHVWHIGGRCLCRTLASTIVSDLTQTVGSGTSRQRNNGCTACSTEPAPASCFLDWLILQAPGTWRACLTLSQVFGVDLAHHVIKAVSSDDNECTNDFKSHTRNHRTIFLPAANALQSRNSVAAMSTSLVSILGLCLIRSCHYLSQPAGRQDEAPPSNTQCSLSETSTLTESPKNCVSWCCLW